MKRFFSKLIYLSPLLFLNIFMECFFRTQSEFAIKKSYLESHLDSIKVMVLGSSLSNDAYNPQYLNKGTINMAFYYQPLSIDYFLVDKYIDRLPNLTTVVLEINTLLFYRDLNPAEWNAYVYSIFFGIKYNVDQMTLKNYSVLASNYEFFASAFVKDFNPFIEKRDINEYGFVVNDFKGRFDDLHYDSVEIAKTFKMNMAAFEDEKFFQKNTAFVRMLVERCRKKGVKVVFVSTPVYKTWVTQEPAKYKNELNSFVTNFCKETGIKYFDFSRDTSFNVRDFKNDNHLNSNGAIKYAGIFNKTILDQPKTE